MSDFVSKDSRGYVVVLSTGAWDHAAVHMEGISGAYKLATQTLTNPDFVLPNPNSPRVIRAGVERYVAYHDTLAAYLVIPVRLTIENEKATGYGKLPAGSRSAVTLYTSTEAPSGARIWTKA